MRNIRVLLTVVGVMLLLLPGFTQPVASWDGLVGLYTQPTAEGLRPGQVAITYSELRFGQEDNNTELKNIWFTGSATAALTKHWEVALNVRNELAKTYVNNDLAPVTSLSELQVVGDVKYIFIRPQDHRIGLAGGVMDLTNTTKSIADTDVGRGRRFFLVGSYQWAHLGLTQDDGQFGAYAGADWNLADHIDLIAEYVTHPTFAQMTTSLPSNTHNFNIGVRMYPKAVPNLRVDLAAIGDGQFNFGFSLSYLL
jgi:hypothetical protein